VALGGAPRAAQAVCLGDCNISGDVTVDEVVVMVNIDLGSAQLARCPAADPDNTGGVMIPQIVGAVHNLLEGCPAEAVCGNGNTDQGEQCDDGGLCIGGDNAGTPCTSDSTCQGQGVCDAFGQRGTAAGVRKACNTDEDCEPAKCIRCKSFGGDGCAVNCTFETTVTVTLVPGERSGTQIVDGTSGAVVHSLDLGELALTLSGTNTLRIGGEKNGLIPVAQTPDGVALDRIPVDVLACACVRGVVYRSCGGTQFEADGQTASTNCTTDASVCADKKPCAPVFGEGASGEGVIGCAGLQSVSYSVEQDAGGSACPGNVMMCPAAGPAIFTITGGGPAGSQLLATSSAIGTVVGRCTGTGTGYGGDGEFCTDDDPEANRGVPAIQTLTTGTASSRVFNVNGFDGEHVPFEGPAMFSGNPITCDQLAIGNRTGGAQAGAFTALDNDPLQDIAVRNRFVLQ
jgi:hypothetical protein